MDLNKLTSDQIIRICSQRNYWEFDAHFFKSALKDPPFHKDIIELIDSEAERVAIAAPRGHAKTTRVSIRHTLWLMLHAKEPYILQVSDTYTQAAGVIAAIKHQLEYNQKLRRIYAPKIVRAIDDAITIETAYGRSKIVARGTGQSLRGIIDEAENRPTLIICDDLEEDKRVENAELRSQDWQWFWKVLIPALGKGGKVRVIGSILHKESLLNRVMKLPDWKSLRYRVDVREGSIGETIWPEMMSWDQWQTLLEQYRQAGQVHTAYCEFLNEPIDAEDAEFKSGWIQVVSLTQDFLKDLIVTTTADLAYSKRASACYTALVTYAWGRTNPPTAYVLDARRGRWHVYETIDQMFHVKHAFNVSRFGIEKVGYQDAMKEVFEMEQQRRQDFVNVDLLPVSEKDERIRGMHSMYARGQVKWANEFPILREEHAAFPHGATRDVIDAEAYQLKMNAISPDLPIPKPKKESGAALIDSVMKRRFGDNMLGTY